MLAPVRTVAPAVLPITLEEAKGHLRVDTTDHDTTIAALLTAGTARFDGYAGILGRALVNQTWRQDFSGFRGCMRLPLAPVVSVTSVGYYDGDNAAQTLDASVYQVLNDARGPFLTLKPDQQWPSAYRREDAISVTHVVGYGADGTNVPADIKVAILLWVQARFDPPTPDATKLLDGAANSIASMHSRVGV